jgi:hypothetical protein
MKPIEFKEMNVILKKPDSMTDEECGSLPVYCDGESCISCWELSDEDIEKLIKTRKLWFRVFSGITQPPIGFTVDKPFEEESDE